LADEPVVIMAGRFHYYEGYSMKEVTFPVRVLKYLGIQKLLITNMAGSTNENFQTGDIIFVRDHINLLPENPLRGPNDDRLGERFPDMLHAYDQDLLNKGIQSAIKIGIEPKKGVYIALQGPNLETPAEYEFLQRIGGDLVGMSTVPEVLVARHMDLPVLVISVVSNTCYPIEMITKTTVEDVLKVASGTQPLINNLIFNLLD
jgi:purine-nucleoside phosphorylase